jgi:signal transduction histidine kinase
VERLAELLDALLDLARVESGSVVQTEVDVSAAARDRVSAWSPVAESVGLRLRLRAGPDLRARAAPGAAERILDVALDNACKFVGQDGTVEVDVRADGATVVLTVADDGPGVSDEALSTLTERFARAAEHHNLAGSGLGLAIAQEIARASGGHLEVRRRRPQGLVLVARLPHAGRGQP